MSKAASTTPMLPGAWLIVPIRVAMTNATSPVMKPIAGSLGSNMKKESEAKQRSITPIAICNMVHQLLGNAIFQLARPTTRGRGVSQTR